MASVDLLSEHPYLQGGPDEIAEHFATIRQNGQFLLALIDDLLDLSRIEAGQLRIEREPCSPAQIVSDVVESLTGQGRGQAAAARGRARGSDTAARSPPIVGGFSRSSSTCWTMRSSSPSGHGPADGPNDRPAGCAATALQFAVSDTGIGMTAAEMGGLFQPFYRVRSGGRGSPGWNGPGPGDLQAHCQAARGRYHRAERSGVGSTFTLSIPAASAKEIDDLAGGPTNRRSHLRSPPAHPLPPRLHGRILVADDNEANRQLISLRLRQAGADVVTAGNGQEALDRTTEAIVEGRPFDAVIMDMQMPVLDGYDAVRQLRARGFTEPIIAVTAYAMSEDREECLGLGCDDFISKPIEWDRFLAKLTRLLTAKEGAAD